MDRDWSDYPELESEPSIGAERFLRICPSVKWQSRMLMSAMTPEDRAEWLAEQVNILTALVKMQADELARLRAPPPPADSAPSVRSPFAGLRAARKQMEADHKEPHAPAAPGSPRSIKVCQGGVITTTGECKWRADAEDLAPYCREVLERDISDLIRSTQNIVFEDPSLVNAGEKLRQAHFLKERVKRLRLMSKGDELLSFREQVRAEERINDLVGCIRAWAERHNVEIKTYWTHAGLKD